MDFLDAIFEKTTKKSKKAETPKKSVSKKRKLTDNYQITEDMLNDLDLSDSEIKVEDIADLI